MNLCVVCHNPAANEGNVRQGFGVTDATAYDGKPGEAYDMRNFIHALHAGGETNMPIVIYRTRGIYFFGSQAGLDDYIATRNWPTTRRRHLQRRRGPGHLLQGVRFHQGHHGDARRDDGRLHLHAEHHRGVAGPHRHHRRLPVGMNRCDACHADTWRPATVDPTKGVAVTVDPGVAPFGNQLNDVLWGPTGASCMSCHQSGVPTVSSGSGSTTTARAGCPPRSRTAARR